MPKGPSRRALCLWTLKNPGQDTESQCDSWLILSKILARSLFLLPQSLSVEGGEILVLSTFYKVVMKTKEIIFVKFYINWSMLNKINNDNRYQ